MKKRKQIIFILILFFTVLISIFLIFYFKPNKNFNTVSNIYDLNEAYDVKICVNKFYEYCKDYRNSAPKGIYELLDDEYIKYYNLTEDNLKNKLNDIDSDKLSINTVYKLSQKRNLSLYLIKADQLYKNIDKSKEFNILLKINSDNNTFSIFLDDYMKDNNCINFNLGERVNMPLNKIKKKVNNTFDSSNKQIYDNVQDIFSDYQTLCMFYNKYAYDKILNSDRDEKNHNYLKDNYKDIITMKMVYYDKTEKDGYIEYKVYDNKNINFNFKVISHITYNVIIRDD